MGVISGVAEKADAALQRALQGSHGRPNAAPTCHHEKIPEISAKTGLTEALQRPIYRAHTAREANALRAVLRLWQTGCSRLEAAL